MKKLPAELTDCEIERSLHDVIAFSDYTFFAERNVNAATGYVFALEQLACSLGLVGDWLYEGDYDSATMMSEFTAAMDKKARETNSKQWFAIRNDIPYLEAPLRN